MCSWPPTKQCAATIKCPSSLFIMILFYNGFSDKIPSQSGLVWLLTKASRVKELASATASQRWSFIVVTIKLQNPEKHCKSAQKPYTRTSKTIKSSLFFLLGPCWGRKSAYRGVPVLVIGNDRPPIVDLGVGQSRQYPTHTSPRMSARGSVDPINRRSHCPLADRHVSPPSNCDCLQFADPILSEIDDLGFHGPKLKSTHMQPPIAIWP